MSKSLPAIDQVKVVRFGNGNGDFWELHDQRDGTVAVRTPFAFVPFTDQGQILAYLYCSLEHFAGVYEHRPMPEAR